MYSTGQWHQGFGLQFHVLWTSGSKGALTDHRAVGGIGEIPTADGTFSLLIPQGLIWVTQGHCRGKCSWSSMNAIGF